LKLLIALDSSSLFDEDSDGFAKGSSANVVVVSNGSFVSSRTDEGVRDEEAIGWGHEKIG